MILIVYVAWEKNQISRIVGVTLSDYIYKQKKKFFRYIE